MSVSTLGFFLLKTGDQAYSTSTLLTEPSLQLSVKVITEEPSFSLVCLPILLVHTPAYLTQASYVSRTKWPRMSDSYRARKRSQSFKWSLIIEILRSQKILENIFSYSFLMFSVGPINGSSKKLFSPTKLLSPIPFPHMHSCLPKRPVPSLCPRHLSSIYFRSWSLKGIFSATEAEAMEAFLKAMDSLSTPPWCLSPSTTAHCICLTTLPYPLQHWIILWRRDISHLCCASQFCVTMTKHPR